MYINNHTYFSLRYGTISPDELLQLATHYHVQTLALTDINSTSACLDFVRLSIKYQIAPVVGVDFRNGVKQEFVMLAHHSQQSAQTATHFCHLPVQNPSAFFT